MLTPRQGCFLLALLLAGPSVSWAQAPATPAADHYNRAVEAISAGRWDQAVDALRQAVSADPQDADAHFQLGYAYRELKRPAEAAEEFQQAIRLRPDDGQAYFQLGWLDNEQGKFAQAIGLLKRAALMLPQDAEIQAELGYAALQLKQYDEAFSAYDAVVQLQPTNARAHFLLGWADNVAGKFSDAVEPLMQAIRLKPDDAPAHSELGYAYRNVKQYTEARAAYQQALRIDPKYAPAHHGLGVTHLALGNKSAAQDELHLLQTLDSDWATKLAEAIGRCRQKSACKSFPLLTGYHPAPPVVIDAAGCSFPNPVSSSRNGFPGGCGAGRTQETSLAGTHPGFPPGGAM